MEKKAPVCEGGKTGEYLDRVVSSLPADDMVIELAEFLEAFADSTRIKILIALSKHELCTCDLSAITGLSVSAVSHQLRVLRDKKLVKYRREGRNVYYSLDDEHVANILRIAIEHVAEGMEVSP
ncbi:metalloregulator ArsR/SmtB family transcription factor [Geoglobus acetivorans]|uniref:Metalloregulator ArsR/SmtB family transcription factor n=1 Tax=Geoglobus acetivorans TaxID=565033 RepID=A0ABZ3H550_GEOAI|nr:helix-turn-helix transcriptional regulator [Geoglobus acetivorans]